MAPSWWACQRLPADPVNQIGWPDAVNTYRLDFRVPKGTHPGMAEVEVTADGITGQPVALPIR